MSGKSSEVHKNAAPVPVGPKPVSVSDRAGLADKVRHDSLPAQYPPIGGSGCFSSVIQASNTFCSIDERARFSPLFWMTKT
jgi:hypothetical protein